MTMSLGEFTQLEVFKKKRLMFRSLGALERMGKVDVIVFEKQGSLSLVEEMQVKSSFIFGDDEMVDSENESYVYQSDVGSYSSLSRARSYQRLMEHRS